MALLRNHLPNSFAIAAITIRRTMTDTFAAGIATWYIARKFTALPRIERIPGDPVLETERRHRPSRRIIGPLGDR
ncbi:MULTISPECIES: hypothetical protein [Leifsonia]|uniref:Uncharacterized protein n=1 Tax=Leifsonia shinshuensis TaxID=150026 RepID=A0A853CXI7_9MICO|nr:MULTISPECIES: hypothetical protein [Leifsonia]MBO1740712.1 hypothetical protein [Leifsonia sp. TF02-11]NYJ25836.1 hypothetical protein [Leifsonia shinshuensis]